jgi:8-oxo-dGTP pyrophosphatase MutT (NUDIX family)
LRVKENAVLVPCHEASGRILVQDRRGHKPPPWGFFGGGIEADETPLGAVLREVREELSFALPPAELTFLGEFAGQYADVKLILHAFLWPFDGKLDAFQQTEGASMELISVDEMLRRTEPGGPDHTLTLALKIYLHGS